MQLEKIRFSIIIGAYETNAIFFRQAIESAVALRWKNLEIHVLDACPGAGLEAVTRKTAKDDPRAELVKSLLEYKMYKYASVELKDMSIDASGAYFKGESIPKEVKNFKEEVDPAELIGDLTMKKLNEIFQTLLKREIDRVDPVRSKFGTITRDEIKLEDKMLEIRTEIKGLRSINFKTLLKGKRGKMNLIVSFLAILELMKSGILTIRQDKMFGEILIDSLE